MQYLHNDLISNIISIADVSIDTYLAFKNIGAIPKKLRLQPDFKNKLDNMFNHRKQLWDKKDIFLLHKTTHINIKIRIQVGADNIILLLLFETKAEHIIIKYFDKNEIIAAYFNIVLYFYNHDNQTTIRYSKYDQNTGKKI